MSPHWKVLLVGLQQHTPLIRKLAEEGHEIHATDVLTEAYQYLATNEYDVIILDADEDPAKGALLHEWLADRRLQAQVIQLTHWRGTSGASREGTCLGLSSEND